MPELVATCFRCLDLDSTHVVGKRHEDPIPMFVGANVKCKGQARLVQLAVVPSDTSVQSIPELDDERFS